MNFKLLFILVCVAMFAIDISFGHLLPPKVVTVTGPLTGTYIKARGGRNISAFLGIPYAKPPIGNLRFRSPVPVEPWSSVRAADSQPRRCFQSFAVERASEDCLYLNVYSPSLNDTSPMAVVVYIYSGGYNFGAIEDYTPEYILEEANIVYVAIQYRLNVFGWFSTGDSVVPGNMGLKDVLLGLTWVQENIRGFGGDPSRVTLWGESSASVMVHLLTIHAADTGLFRAAICHSQTALAPRGFRTPKEVEKWVKVFANVSGCSPKPNKLVTCLRQIPALKLFYICNDLFKLKMNEELQGMLSVPELGPVVEPPCVTDRVVSGNPWHSHITIPLLTGVVSKESLFHFRVPLSDLKGVEMAKFNLNFDKMYPFMLNYDHSAADGSRVAAAVRRWYLQDLPISRTTLPWAVDAFSDPYYIYSVYEAIQRADKNNTFVFYFSHIGVNQLFIVPQNVRAGVSHGEVLLYFFPHPAYPTQNPRVVNEVDDRVSKLLIRLWTNFIIYMNPNPLNSDGMDWKPFSSKESYLHIKQDGHLEIENNFLPKRMDFWRNQPFPVRDDDLGEVPCERSSEILGQCSALEIANTCVFDPFTIRFTSKVRF